MKSKKHPALKSLLVRGGAYSLLFSSAFAADATWNGSANTNLGNGTNWSSASATFGANETATWNNTQTGNLSLQWNGNLGPSSGNAGGLNLSITSANTGSLQLDGVTGNLGLGDVTIASGAGAFTLGDGVGSSNVVFRDPTTTLTNDSANAATIKSDIVFLNGGGAGNRNITFAGSGNWLTEGSVISASAFGTSASSAFITKNGTGTLTLAGANGHGGGATLNGGVIAVSNGSALGTAGTVAINGSFGTRIEVSNNITLTGPTAINLTGRNNTPDNTISGSTIRNVAGNNSISANLVFANVGGTNVNVLSSAGTLTLDGTLSTTLTTGVRTFNLTGAGDIVSNGVISNGSSTVGIIKNGTGTLTINNAANSYTGTTSVVGGVLALGTSGTISNTLSLGTSTPTVASLDVTSKTAYTQANVSGNGTLNIGAGKTFTVSGNLGPGFSPGTINVTGDLGLTASTITTMELAGLGGVAGTDSDFVSVSGTIALDGMLIITGFNGFDITQASTYHLFDAASFTGDLDGVSVGGNALSFESDIWSGSFGATTYSFSENSGVLSVIPEPGAALLGSMGMLALLRRRRA